MRIELKFLSDWHIGTGSGRETDVDATVLRDPSTGLPLVPGKTLKGMLRDAAEIIASALDAALDRTPTEATWQSYVDALFGRQADAASTVTTSGALRFGPAKFSPQYEAGLCNESARSGLATIRASVAIDRRTGLAEARHLRMEERMPADAVLIAPLDWIATPVNDAFACAEALLQAAAGRVEAIGGKRRRGAGRCQLVIEGISADIDRLFQSPAVWSEASASEAKAGECGPGKYAVAFVVESAVVVPSLVAGNTVRTLDYVPGTDLLAALAPRIVAADTDKARAIARGDVRVGPAYLDDLRPVPRCFEQNKLRASDAPNVLHNRLLDATSDSQQRKPLREGYFGLAADGESYALRNVAMIVNTHSTIDNRAQRPTSDVGGVYAYEGIAPGQKLTCQLVVPEGMKLALASNDRLYVGVSKSVDYGVLRVDQIAPVAGTLVPQIEPGQNLVLHLVSPLIAVDEFGVEAPTIEGLRAALRRRFPAIESRLDWATARTWLASRRIDAWMARLQMPRRTLTAIAQGSVVAVRATDVLPSDTLSDLAKHGLGERRAEGFGMIDVNPGWALCAALHVQTAAAALNAPTGSGATTDDFLERVRDRGRRRLDTLRAVAEARRTALDVLRFASSHPPPTQAANLLDTVLAIRTWDDRTRLLRFAVAVGEHERRKKKWPAEALEWLRKLGDSSSATARASLVEYTGLPDITGYTDDQCKEVLVAWLVAAIRFHRFAADEVDRLTAEIESEDDHG